MNFLRWFAISYLCGFCILLVLYPFLMDPTAIEPSAFHVTQEPSWQHPFGTDSLGRDLFSRLVLGARLSFGLGIVCSLISLCIGFVIGALSGLLGGWKDQLTMRLIEIFMSLPQLVTIGFLLLYFNNLESLQPLVANLGGLVLAISLASWMTFARVIRSQILLEKSLPYVEGARAMGVGPWRLLCRHILPNVFPSILVLFGLQIPNFLLFEGFLSFIGFGIQPPTASWGVLLNEGWKTLSVYPRLLLIPSGALFLTIFSVNVIFDEFRSRLLRPLGFDEHRHVNL